MTKLVNRAKMTTATTGTGTITLGTAETGYQSFAAAGVVDGDVVRYVIEDGTDFEIGTGTFGSAGGTLTRTVSESSNADAALNLTGDAVVYVVAAAADILQPDNNLSDLANATTARTNLGLGTIATQNSNSVSVTGGSITGITDLAVADGGTGVSTVPTNGQLLIGNGTGYTVAALTAGTGVSVTNGAGSVTVSNTAPDQTVALTQGANVTITGTYPNFTIASSDQFTGTVTSVGGTGNVNGLSLSGTVTTSGSLTLGGALAISNADWSGTDLAVTNGGTGASTFSANNVLLGNGASAFQTVAPSTAGNVLTSNGSTWTSAPAGAALDGETDSASPFETSLGVGAGAVNTGANNTFIGFEAGNDNTSGNNNVAVGAFALDANTTGASNVAVGSNALGANTTAASNVAIGFESLRFNTTGTQNVAMGRDALGAVTTGGNNTSLGNNAGDNLTTGSNNTVIGNGADASAANVSNEITLGNTAVRRFRIPGAGIDNTSAALSGTTPSVDVGARDTYTLTTSGNTTFTFTNVPASPQVGTFSLIITGGGTHTLTWPASVDWSGGVTPAAPASGETDVYTFVTVNGGTTWYGFYAGDAMA